MKKLRYVFPLLLVMATWAQEGTGRIELVADYRGTGGVVASVVGPGNSAGGERLYASFLYMGKSFDVLSIDPNTGASEVFHSPLQGEYGARGMAVGPDGNIYLGTLPTASFFELISKEHKLIDIGRPSSTESFIWDVAFGSDNRLYGVTYPNCKLVRYDPISGRLEDLGRLDPTEQYARFIVSNGDGFLYIGIGYSRANIAAYNVRTGEHREILPIDAQTVGVARVYRGQDGNCYAVVGGKRFRLSQWGATELKPEAASPPVAGSTLRDGRLLAVTESRGNTLITVSDPNKHTKIERTIHYQGQNLDLFRIGFGDNGALYGSTAIPIHFVGINYRKRKVSEIGNLGEGEVYSFLNHDHRLLMAAYGGAAPLMSYTPEMPVQLESTHGNPQQMTFKGADVGWRPEAMINGPKGIVYVGAVAGYGQLGAPMTEWNVEAVTVNQIADIVQDQSVVSLTVWDDLIVGATSTEGGGGSHPTQSDAHLFMWDPKTRAKVFDIVPVPGRGSVTDLVTTQSGRVYGIAGDTLFEFDPQKREISGKQKLQFANPIYNSASAGKDGKIWGLARDGIFAINTTTNVADLVVRTPKQITGGFGIYDGYIYFVCGSQVYRYKM